jgi:NADPH:quinone reductase-like Zn-dependent oxidoreductase
MPNETACTLGVTVTTIGQGLYQSLGLPLPLSPSKAHFPILIYGGSTATGSLAIQYARLSGCTVITTCSVHNFTFAKSRGAHAVFDYHDVDCVDRIKEFTGGKLAHAFDCISTPASAKICSEAMCETGGVVSYLLPMKHEREDVQVNYTLAYTAMGEGFRVNGREFEARQQDLEFARVFWELSARLVENGQIEAHPQEICDGGLDGVFDGLQRMREGKVSGKKLVYQMSKID